MRVFNFWSFLTLPFTNSTAVRGMFYFRIYYFGELFQIVRFLIKDNLTLSQRSSHWLHPKRWDLECWATQPPSSTHYILCGETCQAFYINHHVIKWINLLNSYFFWCFSKFVWWYLLLPSDVPAEGPYLSGMTIVQTNNKQHIYQVWKNKQQTHVHHWITWKMLETSQICKKEKKRRVWFKQV